VYEGSFFPHKGCDLYFLTHLILKNINVHKDLILKKDVLMFQEVL
jgi:hypothetical protein